jgi:hypothetical protein
MELKTRARFLLRPISTLGNREAEQAARYPGGRGRFTHDLSRAIIKLKLCVIASRPRLDKLDHRIGVFAHMLLASLHRWLGRAYILSAFLMGGSGLYLSWSGRKVVGDTSQHVAVELSAFLILAFATIALLKALHICGDPGALVAEGVRRIQLARRAVDLQWPTLANFLSDIHGSRRTKQMASDGNFDVASSSWPYL